MTNLNNPVGEDKDAKLGYWWANEKHLPSKHQCNKYCRITELIHLVTRKELGVRP